MRKNLKYPMAALQNQTQGTLIYAIRLHPKQGISLQFLTKVDEDMEEMIKQVIGASSANWNKPDQITTFYQTALFGIGSSYRTQFEQEAEGFKKTYTGNWLKPIAVGAYATQFTRTVTTRTTANSGATSSAGSTPNTPSNSTSSRPAPVANQFSVYKKAVTRFSKHMKKKKSKKAYEALNQAILFNPFNRAFLEARRELENELGLAEYQRYDEDLLIALSTAN